MNKVITVACIAETINIVLQGKRQSFVYFAKKSASRTRKILSRLSTRDYDPDHIFLLKTILKIYIQVNSKALHCIPRYWSMTYLTEASDLSHIEGSFKYVTFSYIHLIPTMIRSVHNSSLV